MEGLFVLIALALLAFVFIAPTIALIKAFSVGNELQSLKDEVRRLRAALRSEPDAAEQRIPTPRPEQTSSVPLEEIEQAAAPPTIPTIHDQPAAPAEPPPPPPAHSDWRMLPLEEPVTEPRPRAASRSVAEWEMLIGGNIVNRIAAIGMVIVAAFFVKYAYDHHWITPALVVVIGFAAGFALLFAGSRFHRANAQVFAQGMLGAGISILYLSGYATASYELVAQSVALLIMSAVTVIAVLQALRYNSPVVCILGLLGGFLTPLLLGGHGGRGEINHFGLFAYIVLLDAGLLAVAIRKDSWAMLDPMVLAGTYITFFVWFDQYYKASLFATAVPFAAVVWLLFCCVDICRIVRSIAAFKELRALVNVASSGFFYYSIYTLLDRRFTDAAEFKHWMAVVSLMIGGVYFISLLITLRSRTEDRTFIPRYILTAITLLVIATAYQYEGYLRVMLWAIESAALIWCGIRWNSRSALWAGAALSGMAVVALFFQQEAFGFHIYKTAKTAFWNVRCFSYALIAVICGMIAYLFATSRVRGKEAGRSIYKTACCALLLALLGIETNDYFRMMMAAHETQASLLGYTRYMAIAGLWSIYSLILMALGLWRRNDLLPRLGIGALMLAAGVVVVNGFNTHPTTAFVPMLNVRVAGFAVLATALFVGKCLLSRFRGDWAQSLADAVRVVFALLVLQIVSVETYLFFSGPKHGPWLQSNCKMIRLPLTFLALGVVWVLYSLPTAWRGLTRNHLPLTVIGIGTLAAGVTTIATNGSHYFPIDKFAVIANVRFAAFALGLSCLVIHHWMLAKHRDAYPWVARFLVILQIATSLFAFQLISVETRDHFYRIGTQENALRYSTNMRQMTLSVVWLVYSFVLVSIGFWRRRRTLRFVAIGLFAVTILKVFVSDLSFLEPLYRMFSFAGLALILFATSYLYQRHKSLILGDGPEPEPLPDEAN